MTTETSPRTTSPQRIAADTYPGKWTVRGGRRSGVFAASELATAGQTIVVWEFSGHMNGKPLYVRTRFVGQADGSLAGYGSNGALTIIHPADRKIRVITK